MQTTFLMPITDSFLIPIDSPRDSTVSRGSKWAENLASLTGAPEFVMVKRYLIEELLSLRHRASVDVEVDVHHIENSIVSDRQRAAFRSPIPVVGPSAFEDPHFVPLFVPIQPNKEQSEDDCENKDSDSARSSSPTVVHGSSDEEIDQSRPKSKKKAHRSRRGGKRHPNRNKVATKTPVLADVEAPASSAAVEESADNPAETPQPAPRANKTRASKGELAARSGAAFSSGVMRKRRLAAKERERGAK